MSQRPAAGREPEKLPAKEPEVERQLIARCIYGYRGVHPQPPALAPSRFVSPRHQIIWGAIIDQHRRGDPYDVISVAARLESRGELATAGGRAYLTGLEPDVGTQDSLDYYAALIRRKAAMRVFAPLGRAISELALADPDSPEASVRARYQQLVRRADMVCDWASRNGHAAALTTRTVHQILTSPAPPINWIYEPWLGAGDVVILAGEPGLGKSWVALDLMFALALGRPWATCDQASGHQRVLYIDEENNYRLVRHRIGKLVDGLDIGMADIDPAKMSAIYALENGINFDDPASLDLLKRKLDQLRPDWIIIDSLVRVHRRDENSNAEMSALIGGIIKPMAAAIHAGVIVIHHLGKATKDRPAGSVADRIRGASDIRAVADQVWGLERADDGLLLSHLKCRMDRASSPIAVTLEDTHLGNGLRIAYTKADLDAERIINEALSGPGTAGTPRQDIESAVDTLGVASAHRMVTKYLGRLHATGKVRKRKEGRSVRYWLSDQAPPDAD